MKKIIFFCICLFAFLSNLKALDIKDSMSALADYAIYLKDNYNSHIYYDSSNDYKMNKLDTFNGKKTFPYNNRCLFVMGKSEFISFVFKNATGIIDDENPSYLDIFLLNYNGNWINKSNKLETIKTFNSKTEFNNYELYRGDIIGYSSNDIYDLYIYNGNDSFITITDNYPNSISYVNRSKLPSGSYSIFRIVNFISSSLEKDNAYKTSVVLKTRRNIDFSENTKCIVKTNFTDSVIYKQIKRVYIIVLISVLIIINTLNYLAVKDDMSAIKERGITSIVFRTIIFLILILIPLIIESIMKII